MAMRCIQRRDSIRAIGIALALASISAVQAQTIQPGGTGKRLDHPWPMRYGNMQRNGRSSYPGPDLGQVAWRHRSAGSVPEIAVDRQGRAILGVTFNGETWSGECYLTVLRADGEVDWKVRVVPYPWGASQGVSCGPAINRQGEIIVNSSNGQVLKFAPNGDLKFTYQRNQNMTNDDSPAVMPDGTIYHHQGIPGIVKLTPSGSVIWTAGASSLTDISVRPNGDVSLGGVRSNEPHGSTDLLYYSANGQLLWSKSSSRGSQSVPAFEDDGTIFYSQGTMKRYESNGTLTWSSAYGSGYKGTASLGINREVYCSFGNAVVALDPLTGALVWSTPIPGSVGVNNGLAVDRRGFIYGTTGDGFVFKLSPQGAVLFNVKIADSMTVGPAIGADKSLFVTGIVGFDNFVWKVN
ncbi:MAG: hypothetical protein HONBIEJF_02514 [Fimbriimonadaceae bacterium]|nr:hypothetical protein [Fimbriimonadaceae bacterium]